jgi:hypothetical protein
MCSCDRIKFIVVKKKLLVSQFGVSALYKLLTLFRGMSFASLKAPNSSRDVLLTA